VLLLLVLPAADPIGKLNSLVVKPNIRT
jgi:hypothetical protein